MASGQNTHSEKKSSQGLSIFSLSFVIMYPGPLSSRFTFFLAFLLVKKYWGNFCQPSKYLLVSSPANLIPSDFIGIFFYFEIKGHVSTHTCLNQCVNSVSSSKERFSLFFIHS